MHDALTVDLYEVARMPITVERWHTHYGWSKAEAEKMGESSSEVRVFAVYNDGARRELESPSGRAGEFEMGYGGTGPHNTARAIVADREAGASLRPPTCSGWCPRCSHPPGASAAELETLVVEAADVDERHEDGGGMSTVTIGRVTYT